jgi:hypothetical protein
MCQHPFLFFLSSLRLQSGVALPAESLTHAGFIEFIFEGGAQPLHVHVFAADAAKLPAAVPVVPVESEEMRPEWFPESDIPFAKMWLDDEHWFPLLLTNVPFRARFSFRGHSEIVSQHIEPLQSDGELICPYVQDASTCILIPVTADKQSAIDL